MTVLTIGKRASLARKHLGLNQRDMADRLGISLPGWQHIEYDRNIPSGQTLLKLIQLGFNANWILTGQGLMRFDDEGVLEAGQELGADFPAPPDVSVRPKDPEWGQRLARAIGNRPLERVARAAALEMRVLEAFLAGAKPTLDEIIEIALAIEGNIIWLITGLGEMNQPTLATQLNTADLEQAIDIVDTVLDKAGRVAPPAARAQAVAQVYSLLRDGEQSAASLLDLFTLGSRV